MPRHANLKPLGLEAKCKILNTAKLMLGVEDVKDIYL
jgi:hypothetical protein